MPKLILKHKIKSKKRSEVLQALSDPKNWPSLFADVFEITNLTSPSEINQGSEVFLEITRFGLVSPHYFKIDKIDSSGFSYRQTKGIFKKWHHEIELVEDESGVVLKEEIDYEVAFGLLGHLSHDLFFRQDIKSSLLKRVNKLRELG